MLTQLKRLSKKAIKKGYDIQYLPTLKNPEYVENSLCITNMDGEEISLNSDLESFERELQKNQMIQDVDNPLIA